MPNSRIGAGPEGFGVRALLGPTNTGKTHRAVERMLEHRSGMIGLPLRLLAREVYDKVVGLRGNDAVALITGEEKRVPAHPSYWVCTVEAMPLSLDVDFVAVDEIQMVAHRQRGHVFTQRLLDARGVLETWFMGSHTAKSLVERLVPTAEFDRLTRLSQLRHAQPVSVGALRPKTALVAFSAAEVYELAERIRARRGGAAVVLGALSPRARNAQVAMYQTGEVDFLVATDAIGMGLNMDVDHVVFAGTSKYDGESRRPLHLEELAQIAGRAGRFQRDGSFGVLAGMRDFDPRAIHALENHNFAPLRKAFWRNADLSFESVDALIESLRVRTPSGRPLRAAQPADDVVVLAKLAQIPEIRERAKGRARVQRLWEVCQVPDFRKLLLGQHAEMLAQLYLQVTGPHERVDAQWMATQIKRIDDVDGSIDLLMTRMAFIRTWTYVAGQAQWVRDPKDWQAKTHAVEDRLSDALHQALVARFVESGSRGLAPQAPGKAGTKRKPAKPAGQQKPVTPSSSSPFFKLAELRATLEDQAPPTQGRAWVESIVATDDADIRLDIHGSLSAGGEPLAKLAAHKRVDRPNIVLLDSDLSVEDARRVRNRLQAWMRGWLQELLSPLADGAGSASDAERGCLHALRRGLGSVPLDLLGLDTRALEKGARARLRARGVSFGAHYLFAEKLLTPAAVVRRVALVFAHRGPGLRPPKHPGARRIEPVAGLALEDYPLIGYVAMQGERPLGAWRIDVLERATRQLNSGLKRGDPEAAQELRARVASTLRLEPAELEQPDGAWPVLVEALGFSWSHDGPRRLGGGGHKAKRRRRPRRSRS